MKLLASFVFVIGSAVAANNPNTVNSANSSNGPINAIVNNNVKVEIEVTPGHQVVLWGEDGLYGVSRDILFKVRCNGSPARNAQVTSQLIPVSVTPVQQNAEFANSIDNNPVSSIETDWRGTFSAMHGLAWKGGPLPTSQIFRQQYVQVLSLNGRRILEILVERKIGPRLGDGEVKLLSVVYVNSLPPPTLISSR